MSARIVLAGGSGLIGRQLASMLAEADAHLLVRTKLSDLPAQVEQHVADTSQWSHIISRLKPDIAISCLGTTWKKSGKNEAAFRAVDFDLVLAFASAARDNGARHFISVSSVGASSSTRNFYLRTKAETEVALAALSFDRLDILRPGLLTGERGADRRLGERAAMLLSPLTNLITPSSFSRFQSIPARTVAKAILRLTKDAGPGQFIHENDAIRSFAS